MFPGRLELQIISPKRRENAAFEHFRSHLTDELIRWTWSHLIHPLTKTPCQKSRWPIVNYSNILLNKWLSFHRCFSIFTSNKIMVRMAMAKSIWTPDPHTNDMWNNVAGVQILLNVPWPYSSFLAANNIAFKLVTFIPRYKYPLQYDHSLSFYCLPSRPITHGRSRKGRDFL